MCRGVLFFDTFETLWAGSDAGRSVQSRRLDAWLRQLAKAVRLRGVLIVVAGRDELRWAEDDADWKDAIETHLLGGFSRHDAQIYLAKRMIGPPPWETETRLQRAILDTCAEAPGPDGEKSYLPFYLALCADIVDNRRDKNNGAEPSPDIFIGIPSDQVGKKLADRFLKSLPSEQWELWVRELSLTPSFDERAALALDRERHHSLGRVGWKQLCRYSFLEPQPEGYFRLHKTMREVLRSGLGDEAADVDTWFRDHWLSREDSALAFFHQWSLDPATMLNGWLAEHESALKNCRIRRPVLCSTTGPRFRSTDSIAGNLAIRFGREPMYSSWPGAQSDSDRAACPFPKRRHHALRVCAASYTEEDFPSDWAKIQNGLGSAYLALPTGDRDENLRRAIAFYESALRVTQRRTSPRAGQGYRTAWAAPTRPSRRVTAVRTSAAPSPATSLRCESTPKQTSQRTGQTYRSAWAAPIGLPDG